MNDPQVLVTSVDNPTGVWIDLTECCDSEEFDEKVLKELCASNYVVSDSHDIPKCFIKNGSLDPEVFRYARYSESDRTIVFAYSKISTDPSTYILKNAFDQWVATHASPSDFAREQVKHLPIIAAVLPYLSDCIDYDKLAAKFEQDHIFVEITSKTYVFLK